MTGPTLRAPAEVKGERRRRVQTVARSWRLAVTDDSRRI